MFKQIEFAHPTSTLAERLGHEKTGTWYVADKQFVGDTKDRCAIAFPTYAKAVEHCVGHEMYKYSQKPPLDDKPIW